MTTKSTTNIMRIAVLIHSLMCSSQLTAGLELIIDTALEIATTYGAIIHVLYVIDTRSKLGHWDFVIEQRDREGERAVETIVARGIEWDVKVVAYVRYGTLLEAICTYVDDHDYVSLLDKRT